MVGADTRQNRRTYYGLKKESPISDAEIEAIVKRSVKHSPNSFNMQQSRAIVLTGKHHDLLWDKVIEASDKNSKSDGELQLYLFFGPLSKSNHATPCTRYAHPLKPS